MRLAACHALIADPAWRFGDKLPGKKRGASNNYPTQSLVEICAFPLPPIAADAILFLWRVASMQQEALDVIRAWDFKLKTEIVWIKRTPAGKRWFGMGRTLRAEHETCLIATRGRPILLSKSIRSTFEAPALEHSQKPDAFYAIVEQLIAGPYTELFARRRRPGWQCLGNEAAGNRLEKVNGVWRAADENPGSHRASRVLLPGEELDDSESDEQPVEPLGYLG